VKDKVAVKTKLVQKTIAETMETSAYRRMLRSHIPEPVDQVGKIQLNESSFINVKKQGFRALKAPKV
jgi:hypothetical protein